MDGCHNRLHPGPVSWIWIHYVSRKTFSRGHVSIWAQPEMKCRNCKCVLKTLLSRVISVSSNDQKKKARVKWSSRFYYHYSMFKLKTTVFRSCAWHCLPSGFPIWQVSRRRGCSKAWHWRISKLLTQASFKTTSWWLYSTDKETSKIHFPITFLGFFVVMQLTDRKCILFNCILS